MSKNPNDNENTIPYNQIDPGEMREDAEECGNSGPNEQVNAGRLRGEAVRHGNSGENKQVDAAELRREAVKHGSTDRGQHARHEREIASLDRKAGHEKGGR